MRIPHFLLTATTALSVFAATEVAAAPPPSIPLAQAPSYADLADLALAAPIVAGVEIRRSTQLKGAAAAAAPAGKARFYVEADVRVLIRGQQGLPAQVSYLVDLPLNARDRAPKLRKARALVLAATVPGRAGALQLVAPYAQLPWTEPLESQLRAVLTEATRPDPAPRITRVGKAFFVPGSLPGESETQIFLNTEDGRPVSLNVLRRPGETPRWAVALGEMVDEAAAPPQRDTLLWYGLACFLPRALPAASTAELTPDDAAAATRDYQLVIEGLGPCVRNYARS
ncbi:MAG: hypothetical protein JWM38_737 [Sphingomonas bacterium]|nr:hypothetical protein [Sphingomonas bacterium]